MFARILIPVDASEPAQRAVEMAGSFAGATGAVVKLVHVVHPTPSFIPLAPSEKPACEEAERLLAKLRRQVPAGVETDCEVLEGVPAEQIVAVARRWDADLVVVGDHNRHVLSRFLLGSVADAVVRHAPCSVLVVRPKDQTAGVPCDAGRDGQ